MQDRVQEIRARMPEMLRTIDDYSNSLPHSEYVALRRWIESAETALAEARRRERAAESLIGNLEKALFAIFGAREYVKPNTGVWHSAGVALGWIKDWRGPQEAKSKPDGYDAYLIDAKQAGVKEPLAHEQYLRGPRAGEGK